jgi:hypothetical protein
MLWAAREGSENPQGCHYRTNEYGHMEGMSKGGPHRGGSQRSMLNQGRARLKAAPRGKNGPGQGHTGGMAQDPDCGQKT